MVDDQRRALPRPPGHSTPGQARVHEDHDRVLLRRMADGDEAALAELYDLWTERVHTLAFWILRDADDAEDVVEETFWQAWRTANRYDGHRGTGSTWLMLIARSRALDRLRNRRRREDWSASPSTASALLDEAVVRRTEIPSAQVERMEWHSELASALGALPPEQREAVELAYLEGLSHSEIAARTSHPLGTVKTRIRLAMQKLRQVLRSLNEDGS